MKRCRFALVALMLLTNAGSLLAEDNPSLVVFEGTQGPGVGKHIVFIAGDEEYRSEESLPAMARILAKHYGFKCSVFFCVNEKTGFIDKNSSNIHGLEALKTADLMFVFLRFRHFADDQMQHIVDYTERGGPVIGLRTSTHAFKLSKDNKFFKYTTKGTPEFKGGFGRQILGETWVGHYGRNHQQSSRLQLEEKNAGHPVLIGVKNAWVQCGGYNADPIEGSTILARGVILNGMKPDAPADPKKEVLPVCWVREYTAGSGKKGRAFCTTHGASEDITNDGFRRMLVNASLWTMGMEKEIKADLPIDLVGPYQPTTFSFGGGVKGVKPADLSGWESPILPKK